SQLPLALPWAAVLGFIHALGGDPGLAQRAWYTVLFVIAGLSALGLVRALGMSPLAGTIGALVYIFNPYVVSEVNTNPVFLAALGPLAGMPALLAAAGTRRLPVRWSVVLVAVMAPLLGYVFFNPPLVGMILCAMLATPLVVAWVEGSDAGFRTIRALILALPILLLASAYWIIPAILHTRSLDSSQLSNIASWSWTETRATLRNA